DAVVPRPRDPGADPELGHHDQPRSAVHLLGLVVQRLPGRRDHAGRARVQLLGRRRARRAGGGGRVTTQTQVPFPDGWLDRFDDFAGTFVKHNDVPGAAVAVTKDGETVYLRASGLRDREAGLAATPSTRFGIASLTKSFT